MKKLLLAGVAGIAITAAAPVNAADLRMPVKAPPAIVAPAPYFSWTGCYLGAHVGWGWGHKDTQNISRGTFTSFLSGSTKTSGPLFGGQIGCDYQFQGNWVIGIEGSASAADINGFHVGQDFSSGTFHAKTDFLGSITGRIGWAGWDPRVLLYFKGGVAWEHERMEFSGGTNGFNEHSFTGWTIGLGVEWAFAQNWSAFAEWDHYDFGTHNAGCFVNPTGSCLQDISAFNQQTKSRIDTVKLGLNYRWGGLPFGKGVMARY